jgi:hypothetical protein
MKPGFFARLFLIQSIVISFLTCWSHAVFGWNVPTHEAISRQAALTSQLSTSPLLQQFGFVDLDSQLHGTGAYGFTIERSIVDWIRHGSKFEDGNVFQLTRPRNHFHNPICAQPWTTCQPPWADAGLNDFGLTGESALLWAQDPANNNWAWQGVRQAYSDALTATTDTDREHRFAQTFRGIGHVIHLIQDMGVPAHVRNDQHLDEGLGLANGLESWASNNRQLINNFINTSVIPPLPQGPGLANLAPITQFWDTDRYDGTTATLSAVSDPNIGLAEYTNANYFSEDTIAAPVGSRHHFDFPSTQINDYTTCADTAPPGSQGQFRWYLGRATKMGGDCPIDPSTMDHALAGSFLPSPAPEQVSSSLQLDAKVHEEYSRDLIPHAVGYSVGLINYFFRGQIELSLPDRGVYAISDGSTGFTNFRIKAKNISTIMPGAITRDAMTDGSITLVIKYSLALEDPFRPVWVPVEPNFTYIVAPVKNSVRSIPMDPPSPAQPADPVELEFDLKDSPLPLWATNVYVYIVYRGVLGDEQDAVAVGYKDVSEPTPSVVTNGMDYVCLNGTWYAAGSDAALQVVDANHNGIADEFDIYAHGIINGYLRFSSGGSPVVTNASNYNALFPNVPPAQFGRVFVITDGTTFSIGQSATRTWLDSRDTLLSSSSSSAYVTLSAVKRQSEWVNGVWADVFFLFPYWRGVYGWPIWGWFNTVYGSGTCLIDDLSGTAPDLTGPVPVTLQ